MLAGIVASMYIELGQELFRSEREATPRDVLANVLGTAVGTVVVHEWGTPTTANQDGPESRSMTSPGILVKKTCS